MTNKKYRIVSVGETGVGKSSIINKYINNIFISNISNTIGIDSFTKEVLVDNEVVELRIWDTAGQEKFNSITKSYYRGSHGFIFVFDLSDSEGLNRLERKIEEIKEDTNVQIGILIGNKADLVNEVDENEIKRLSNKLNMNYFICSAKDGFNVNKAFEFLSKEIHYKFKNSSFNKTKKVNLNKKKKRYFFC
ncbi:RAB1 [Hepatospora eriocheir]|uniref:RAB1 n=1 Tax=Hepatospora eriocheir TaxID=1081669 RepID=A0A1X0Q9J5_9MICR|nr:RAB1 [Hepatospora eriocheir]